MQASIHMGTRHSFSSVIHFKFTAKCRKKTLLAIIGQNGDTKTYHIYIVEARHTDKSALQVIC
jgi:hypothetical protein